MTVFNFFYEMTNTVLVTEIKQIDINSPVELHSKLLAIHPAHMTGNCTEPGLFKLNRLFNL